MTSFLCAYLKICHQQSSAAFQSSEIWRRSIYYFLREG
jgi:hypothetical protein